MSDEFICVRIEASGRLSARSAKFWDVWNETMILTTSSSESREKLYFCLRTWLHSREYKVRRFGVVNFYEDAGCILQRTS